MSDRNLIEEIERLTKINTEQSKALKDIRFILLPIKNSHDPFDNKLDRINVVMDTLDKSRL